MILPSKYPNIFRLFQELDVKISFEKFCMIAEIKKPVDFYFLRFGSENEALFWVWSQPFERLSQEETSLLIQPNKKTKNTSKYFLRHFGFEFECHEEFILVCENFGLFQLRGLIEWIQASNKHLKVLFKRTQQKQLFDFDWVEQLKTSGQLDVFGHDLEAGLLDFFIQSKGLHFNFYQNPRAILIFSTSAQLRD